MTIRTKILLNSLIAIILSFAASLSIFVWQMRGNAAQDYAQSSQQQIFLVNEYIKQFLENILDTCHSFAEMPAMQDSSMDFPNFSKTRNATPYTRASLTDNGRALFDLWGIFAKNHEFSEIFSGYPNGALGSSQEADIPPGFNTSERPWYQETLNNPKQYTIGQSYLSYTKQPVAAATYKIFKGTGLTGIMGVEFSLVRLNDLIAALKFGETGRFILIESNGRILSNPAARDTSFKNVRELDDSGLKQLFDGPDGVHTLTYHGKEVMARVLKGYNGYTLIAMMNTGEIYANSTKALINVLIMAAILTLVLGFVSQRVARSIGHPLHLLVAASERVTEGDFDSMPEPKIFSGELAVLRESLGKMIDQVRRLLTEAENSVKEAEHQTELAQTATRTAEEAQRQAEQARHEGLLDAAGQLENIVLSVHGASTSLNTQIDRAEQGASVQADRTLTSATAVEEMNSAVSEVAKNAESAAVTTAETRSKATEGAHLVDNCVSSIKTVQDSAESLKTHMTTLGGHAQNINRIMGVISDIADQTNLLALNAAIEAARAGEAGRGFAVVADEVRKLAEKTMTSTADVAEAIKAIQNSSQVSMEQVELTVDNVSRATEIAGDCGRVLKEIVLMSESAADQVRVIATAAEEQSATSDEITRAINEVNEIAQQTSSSMKEAADTVSVLSREAQQLSEMVDVLKAG